MSIMNLSNLKRQNIVRYINSVPFNCYLILEGLFFFLYNSNFITSPKEKKDLILIEMENLQLFHEKPRNWVNIITAFDLEVKLANPTLILSDPIINRCEIATKIGAR